jgi:hypothetical protein
MFKFNRERLISFYDVKLKEPGHGAHVNAITGLWGEDLLLGLLRHFWFHKEHCTSEILKYTCTTGNKRGPRLDAWVLKTDPTKDKALFQVEVKNWSAYSMGGETLQLDAAKQELEEFSEGNWSYWFEGRSIHSNVSKVIEVMVKPEDYAHLPSIPLLCLWYYICDSRGRPYRIRSFGKGKEVHVFSASAYLRSLRSPTINIDMPRAERRLAMMKEIGWMGATTERRMNAKTIDSSNLQ